MYILKVSHDDTEVHYETRLYTISFKIFICCNVVERHRYIFLFLFWNNFSLCKFREFSACLLTCWSCFISFYCCARSYHFPWSEQLACAFKCLLRYSLENVFGSCLWKSNCEKRTNLRNSIRMYIEMWFNNTYNRGPPNVNIHVHLWFQ